MMAESVSQQAAKTRIYYYSHQNLFKPEYTNWRTLYFVFSKACVGVGKNNANNYKNQRDLLLGLNALSVVALVS